MKSPLLQPALEYALDFRGPVLALVPRGKTPIVEYSSPIPTWPPAMERYDTTHPRLAADPRRPHRLGSGSAFGVPASAASLVVVNRLADHALGQLAEVRMQLPGQRQKLGHNVFC